ncbi:MAG: patatin-like phospholipase family protein [Actinomycetia bacterium]|nr:patatin-like phospholipase family protein [Actinomycetes bacterium]
MTAAPAPSPRSVAPFALALSGGGLLGAAHLGVLAVLDEAGLQPAAVAGTSAGGLVAGLLALGVPARRIQEVGAAVAARPWDYFGVNAEGLLHDLWPGGRRPATGLISPRRFLQALLALAPRARSTRDWLCPCAVTAVDVVSLTAVAFAHPAPPPPRGGPWLVVDDVPLELALGATMAIPGLFVAPRWGRRVLVDGGVADTLPMDWARALGPDRVVAVTVTAPPPVEGETLGITGVLSRADAYWTETLSRLRAPRAPVFTIAPDTTGVPFFGFGDYAKLVEAGRRAAAAALPDLLAFLAPEAPLRRIGAG